MAAVVAVLLMAPVAMASLSQGFATTTPVAIASLVALDAKTTGNVVVADINNSGRLFGVAVSPSSADISLGSGSPGQVQVATTGTATVFVTTTNGAIHVGDYISVSPIAGVGQKAVGKSRVIGTAQVDFDGSGTNATRRTIDTGSGSKEVAIGQIPVIINVTDYTASDGQNYSVPLWLQNFSNVLAGKPVTPVRIIIAAIILIISMISVTVLLYAAVRNSIISIGRNPLSRSSVYKGLFQVLLMALVVLGIGIGAMYLVITR
jgi:hypothetical protein